MDQLTFLLQRFALSAGVFHSGRICGLHHFERDSRSSHLHLVRRGPVRLVGGPMPQRWINDPSLLFMPRPDVHSLVADDLTGAEVVCATVRMGTGGQNPITDSLPDVVLVALSDLPGSQGLLDLLADEAFREQPGRQASLDRLCELLLIRLFRHCMQAGLTTGGTLAGLADARLSKAIIAITTDPAHDWSLNELAGQAGMSRARFAARFRSVTGATPGEFIANWRVLLAQKLLRRGRSVKQAAAEVGFSGNSALTRAFSRVAGTSPGRWLKDLNTAQPPLETTGQSFAPP